MSANIHIDNTLIDHLLLVAGDIKDHCSLGMDIMQNMFIISLQNKKLILNCAASQHCVGAELSQEQEVEGEVSILVRP